MASMTRTYPSEVVRRRFGGPRRRRPIANRSYYESNIFMNVDTSKGSHMPIDATPHWRWDNPLNIIPAIFIFLFVLALVAMMI